MLMSVTERYKEIGTMKCLGALDSFVVKLFFIESCVLGFLASLLGGIMGWLVISLINIFTIGLQAFNGEYGAGSTLADLSMHRSRHAAHILCHDRSGDACREDAAGCRASRGDLGYRSRVTGHRLRGTAL